MKPSSKGRNQPKGGPILIDFECGNPTEEVKKSTIGLLRGAARGSSGVFQSVRQRVGCYVGHDPGAFKEAQKSKGLIETALLVDEEYLGKTMPHPGPGAR